jgi:hypothetical protein
LGPFKEVYVESFWFSLDKEKTVKYGLLQNPTAITHFLKPAVEKVFTPELLLKRLQKIAKYS